jgi:hypothetical protein
MNMDTEFFRLNKCLRNRTGIEEKEELFKKAIEMDTNHFLVSLN